MELLRFLLPYSYFKKSKKLNRKLALLTKLNHYSFNKIIDLNNNRLTLFFTKSNLHLSIVTGEILLFSLSIGEYKTLIGNNRAL